MKNIVGNLVLVGMMGAGKTTLGRQLAEALDRPFFDSDQVICERTGVNIPTIFEMEGEIGFRDRESVVIKELTEQKNIILATGGGSVLRLENQKYLRQNSWIIYLHATPEILFMRIKNDKSRPLLQVEDPLAKLFALYEQRDPIYRSIAHLVCEVGHAPCQFTLNEILKQITHNS